MYVEIIEHGIAIKTISSSDLFVCLTTICIYLFPLKVGHASQSTDKNKVTLTTQTLFLSGFTYNYIRTLVSNLPLIYLRVP